MNAPVNGLHAESTSLSTEQTIQFANKDFIIGTKVTETLFFMNLNRENKGNKLSVSFMDSIMNHIDYYEANQTLKSVILRSFDQKTFSQGTDFKSLEFAIAQGDKAEVVRQLDKLQEFAEHVAATNLAMLTNLNGVLSNSAASIFTQLPFVYDAGNTRLVFNEVDMQSPLLGGVSYTLSRLPDNLGAYLALTGSSVRGKELLELDFVQDYAVLDHENAKHIAKCSIRLYDVQDFKSSFAPIFGQKLSKTVDIDESIKEYFIRSRKENPKNVLFDLYYRKKIIEHGNVQIKRDLNDPRQWLGEGAEEQAGLENYLWKFAGDVLSGLPEPLRPEHQTFSKEERATIAFAFGANNISEIISRLQDDGSEFALQTMDRLKSKNPLLLEVILRQLREAEGMAFGECLKMEYATALAMTENAESCSWVFKKHTKIEEQSEKDLPYEEMTAFGNKVFCTGTEVSDVSFSKVPKSFLPVKHYYDIFPEAFRCYFNSQALRRPELEANYVDVVKQMLILYGIDHFSPAFDKLNALTKLRQLFQLREKDSARLRRLSELINSPQAKDRYFETRLKAIQDLTLDRSFGDKIEEIIKQVYHDQLKNTEDLLTNRIKSLLRIDNHEDIERLKKSIVHRMSDRWHISEAEKEQEVNMLLNLPVEIASDRFSLTAKSQELSKLSELKKIYERKLSIQNKDELKRFYMNLFHPHSDFLQIVKKGEASLFWDKNHILNGLYEREDHTRAGLQQMLYPSIYQGKDTRIETSFKTRFFDMVIKSLKKQDLSVDDKTKQQVLEIMKNEIVLDYKWANTIDKIKQLEKEQFIHFLRQLKPSIAQIDLEKFVPNYETVNVSKKTQVQPKQQEINLQSVKDLNKINFEIKTPEPAFIASGSSECLFDLLFNNDIFSKEKIKQLTILLTKMKQPFVLKIKEEAINIWETKFYDLYKNNVLTLLDTDVSTPIGSAFANSFQREAKNEFLAFIAPHLLYNMAAETMKRLEQLFNVVGDFVGSVAEAQGNISKTYPMIAKMFVDAGFEADSEENLLKSINLADQILNFMIEISGEYRPKLNMREDIIKVITQDIKRAIRMKFAVLKTQADRSTDMVIQKGYATLEDMGVADIIQKMTPEEQAEVNSDTKKLMGYDAINEVKELPLNRLRRFMLEAKVDVLDQEYDSAMPMDELATHGAPYKYHGDSAVKLYDKLNVRENNLFQKLKGYTETLREFMRTIHQNDLSQSPGSLSFTNPIGKHYANGLEGVIERVLDGLNLSSVSIKEFMEHMVPENAPLKKNLEVIRQAIDDSYFAELTYSIRSLSNALEYGSYAEGQRSELTQFDNLRKATIVRRLSDGIEIETPSDNNGYDRILSAGMFKYVNKLENLSRSYFQGQEAGCYESFYYLLNDENTRTPKEFNELDQRQSASDWLDLELYKYISSVLETERTERPNRPLDINSSSVSAFIDQKMITEHLTRKLYTELWAMERFAASANETDKSVDAKVLLANKSEPWTLDWKKMLENEELARRFIAFEAYAFNMEDTTKIKRFQNQRYLQELGKRVASKSHKQRKSVTDFVEPVKVKTPLQTERLYEEIVNSMTQREPTPADALKKDLSDSLKTVSDRLKLYR